MVLELHTNGQGGTRLIISNIHAWMYGVHHSNIYIV
jgi:hypothetical protein